MDSCYGYVLWGINIKSQKELPAIYKMSSSANRPTVREDVEGSGELFKVLVNVNPTVVKAPVVVPVLPSITQRQ